MLPLYSHAISLSVGAHLYVRMTWFLFIIALVCKEILPMQNLQMWSTSLTWENCNLKGSNYQIAQNAPAMWFAFSSVNTNYFKIKLKFSSSNCSKTLLTLFYHFDSTLFSHTHEVFPCLFWKWQRHWVWLNKYQVQFTA